MRAHMIDRLPLAARLVEDNADDVRAFLADIYAAQNEAGRRLDRREALRLLNDRLAKGPLPPARPFPRPELCCSRCGHMTYRTDPVGYGWAVGPAVVCKACLSPPPPRRTTRVRELRLAKGWTQEELSFYSGVSRKTLDGAESGAVRKPLPHTLACLARALGVKKEDLLEVAS